MSRNFENTNGYGIYVMEINSEKLFMFLLNNFPSFKEQMNKQSLGTNNILNIQNQLKNKDAFDRRMFFGRILSKYKTPRSNHRNTIFALIDYIKHKYPEFQDYIDLYHDEDGSALILFVNDIFPNKIINKSEIDNIFKTVMTETDIEGYIDYLSGQRYG